MTVPAATIVLAVVLVCSVLTVATASTSVNPTNLGALSTSVTPNGLKPAACTVTVSSIDAGSGIFSTGTSNQLVLGSSGNDTITVTGNDDCIVGGAGVDTVTALGTGDQCIVSTQSILVTNCTVVERSP
jgi:hypothetical protein